MASSSAPLFAEDPFGGYFNQGNLIPANGANQFLGDNASHHDGQFPEVSGGIVGLERINSTSPLGSPNKANPAGAQTS